MLLSIAVRLPQLDRPLSRHHEFGNALMLLPMSVWHDSSAEAYGYAPVMTYPGRANANINSFTYLDLSRGREQYYLSFPALGYVLPYAAFQAVGIAPAPVALRVFNLVGHLLCAALLFGMVRRLTRTKALAWRQNVPSLGAAAAYLLSPTPMWFQGNVYNHHSLAAVWLCLSLYALTRLLDSERHKLDNPALWLLGIGLLGGMLTAWLGAIVAAVVAAVLTVFVYRRRLPWWVLAIPVVAVLLGIGITTYQYAQVVGLSSYVEYLQERFLLRTGGGGRGFAVGALMWSLLKWYAIGYLPILAWLALMGAFYKPYRWLTGTSGWVVGAAFGIAAIHHIALSDFTVIHNYSVLIDGLGLSLLVGLGLQATHANHKLRLALAMLGAALLLSVAQFYYINRPGDYNIDGQRYDYFAAIADTVRVHVAPDEVIFVRDLKPVPAAQVMYYAKRNFYQVDTRVEADSLLLMRGASRGVLLEVESAKVPEVSIVRLRR